MIVYSNHVKSNGWTTHIFVICCLGILAGAGIGAAIAWMSSDLPPVDVLTQYRPAIQTVVLDSDGNRIGRYYEEQRIVLKRSEIPDHVIQTLVAAEDQEFYRHNGFDLPGIIRAMVMNIRKMRVSQGASTITQQVARMMFLTNERTYTRKIKEAIMTAKIERRFSKDEIITMYLNQAYFGHSAYGVEAAARRFFSKTASELTIPESALLMSVLKNPRDFSPIMNPDAARNSRNLVLDRMYESRFITGDERDRMKELPIELNPEIQQGDVAPYFVEEIRKQLVPILGDDTVVSGGLTVNSTLIRLHQEAANRAVAAGLEAFLERHPEMTDIQMAFVSLRPGTGEITAMVGGSSFRKTQFNRAVQARRQSGSVIKPFVYLTALENGFNGSSIIMDTVYEYRDPQTGAVWRPGNYDNKFRGPVTLRNCLEDSLNVPTAKLVEKVGLEAFLETARKAGITSTLPPYPSTALGAGEVTLIELVNAFGSIAAGGLRARPRLYYSVMDHEDRVVLKTDPEITEVFSIEPCCQLTSILQGAVQHGTCWRAKVLGQDVAAKTGTTDDYTNAWFVGYVPDLAAGVWVGFDLNESMG
ncbi:MAG TPA: PBP1A family penicillin-binding protein, partial [bacterium]|nr:PBP1A family penicillin-binding protein [bacterium]